MTFCLRKKCGHDFVRMGTCCKDVKICDICIFLVLIDEIEVTPPFARVFIVIKRLIKQINSVSKLIGAKLD